MCDSFEVSISITLEKHDNIHPELTTTVDEVVEVIEDAMLALARRKQTNVKRQMPVTDDEDIEDAEKG